MMPLKTASLPFQIASQPVFGMGKSGERMPAVRLQCASTLAVVAFRFTSS